MPYANKADKAAQMRRYRARKRMERTTRSNHLVNVPIQRSLLVQPQHLSRVDSPLSAFSILKQSLDSMPKPTLAPTMRYRRVAEIPSELLTRHGITRQGNALNAPAGVDIAGVLRILLK
jgi:hypothetical protein